MKNNSKRFFINFGIVIIVLTPVIIFLMIKQNSIHNATGNELLDFITKPLQSSKVPKINVDEAAARLSAYVFLDSREKEEYNVSHIKNSIYVGDSEFNIDKIAQVSKDANIIVYCAVGVRSDKIAKRVIDAGYTHVHNMFGGIFEWINEGNPVFDNTEKPTPYIHAYSKFWGVFVRSNHKVYK